MFVRHLLISAVLGCLLYLGLCEVYSVYLNPLLDALTGIGE